MSKFLKRTEITTVNGGYLVEKEGQSPINHPKFVELQKQAEYIITFAKHAKGKDFEGKKADSLADVRKAVNKELYQNKPEYVSKPEKIEETLNKKLKDEAMAFMNYKDEVSKVDKINNFLQQFNVLAEFEEFGLFFENGIVKLNKIYTMEEIVNAVKETINLLD